MSSTTTDFPMNDISDQELKPDEEPLNYYYLPMPAKWGLRQNYQNPAYVLKIESMDPENMKAKFTLASEVEPHTIEYCVNGNDIEEISYFKTTTISRKFKLSYNFIKYQLSKGSFPQRIIQYCNLYTYFKQKMLTDAIFNHQVNHLVPSTYVGIFEDDTTTFDGSFPSKDYSKNIYGAIRQKMNQYFRYKKF